MFNPGLLLIDFQTTGPWSVHGITIESISKTREILKRCIQHRMVPHYVMLNVAFVDISCELLY